MDGMKTDSPCTQILTAAQVSKCPREFGKTWVEADSSTRLLSITHPLSFRRKCELTAEEAGSANEVVDVAHSELDVVWLGSVVGRELMFDHKTLDGDVLLPLVQDFACLRALRKYQRREKSEEHGDEAFEEEYVAPGVDWGARSIAPARNPRKACRQETTKRPSNRCRRYEDADSEKQLPSSVVIAQEECKAWHGAAFEHAE